MLVERSLWLDERNTAFAEQERVLLDLRHQLGTKVAEIEALKLLIAKLRRMQFGRKSENPVVPGLDPVQRWRGQHRFVPAGVERWTGAGS
jgi:hypothetical protein